MREIAQSISFKEFNAGDMILNYSTQPRNFYMILSGQVSSEIKNPIIDQWDWANNIYHDLLNWKKNEFDKKVEREMQMHLIKAKLLADTRQIIKLTNNDSRQPRP